MEKINPSIRVPRGYTCSSCDDLLVAYQMLGAKEVVVKPVLAPEGESSLLVSSPEELRLYDFPLGARFCPTQSLAVDPPCAAYATRGEDEGGERGWVLLPRARKREGRVPACNSRESQKHGPHLPPPKKNLPRAQARRCWRR